MAGRSNLTFSRLVLIDTKKKEFQDIITTLWIVANILQIRGGQIINGSIGIIKKLSWQTQRWSLAEELLWNFWWPLPFPRNRPSWWYFPKSVELKLCNIHLAVRQISEKLMRHSCLTLQTATHAYIGVLKTWLSALRAMSGNFCADILCSAERPWQHIGCFLSSNS